MRRAKKIGYTVGGILAAAILLTDGGVSYILSHPNNPYYCQTMRGIFGTHDCSPYLVQTNHVAVVLIAAAMVILGGFLGEIIGKFFTCTSLTKEDLT